MKSDFISFIKGESLISKNCMLIIVVKDKNSFFQMSGFVFKPREQLAWLLPCDAAGTE